MMDSGNMSIQASLKRFKSSEKPANPLDHFVVSSSCSGELLKSLKEHTLSLFCEMKSQRIPEVLDSISRFERFSVENSFVHFCISDKSILQ